MKVLNKLLRPSALLLFAMSGTLAMAQDKPARTMFRLFWQDTKTNQLMWGDVKRADNNWSIEPQVVTGFPKLDLERQGLVQMQAVDGAIVVGIRDEEAGKFQSGWVSIDAGVTVEDHGDHSHWYYKETPKVISSRLDDQQGNPAHVYLYDEQIILANDSKNGFTVLTKEQLRSNDPRTSGTFFSAAETILHWPQTRSRSFTPLGSTARGTMLDASMSSTLIRNATSLGTLLNFRWRIARCYIRSQSSFLCSK